MEEIKDRRLRGKGSRGPYRTTEPDIAIPDIIKLPDGREFVVKDLTKKQNGTRNYNLLQSRDPVGFNNRKKDSEFQEHREPKLPKTRIYESPSGHKSKYTQEERLWQCTAHVKEIEKRYNMKPKTARATQSYARKLMNFKKIETDECVIIDYTKANVS